MQAIYQDQDRNLWIGTDEGLNRYNPDSEGFAHFQNDPNNTNSLSHNSVRVIYQDSKGALWIGTDDGLNKLEPGSERFIHFKKGANDSTGLISSDESIRQMVQEAADDGLWVTTTLYLMRSIADQAADLEGVLTAMPEVKYVHPGVFDTKKWGPGENYYADVGSRPWWPEYLAAQEKMVPALNDSGGLLMSGTDASLAVVVPGFSLHNELETMADVGLSPYDVLRTSTYNPALYHGELQEFGTVETGKRADLVLLEGNPLEDIANTQEIAGVMVRGRYYTRADLDLMLEAVAKDYEAVKSTQAIVRIAFPIVVILLLVALVWFIVRRRKANQVSS